MRSGTTAGTELQPLPEGFAATRAALHRVAEEIVAPSRKPESEIALEPTPGGFGTPFFDHDGARQRVRVDGDELVHEFGERVARAPLDSLHGAGELVSALLGEPPQDATALEVDPASAATLADWYALGAHVLGQLVDEAGDADEASPPRLWPEHFDLAIELGTEATGARANYGFSPGDYDHPEPYIYVGPWSGEIAGELWQAQAFRGAELGYADLVGARDPAAAALAFCRARKEALITTTEERPR